MKPKHPTASAPSAPGHRHPADPRNAEPPSAARLQNFLRAAIPSSDPATRLAASAQSDEFSQAAESRPSSSVSNPPSEISNPSSSPRFQPETQNSKLETHSFWSHALAARDESHRQAFAQIEARLAAAEQNLTNLSGQLREMR
jgi:hypothetical protein